MSSLDVLLINVPLNREFKKDLVNVLSAPPQGLLYIAAHLKRNGFTIALIDMAVNFFKKNEFLKYLNEKKPKIIGISSFTESWAASIALAKILRKTLPDSIIVSGGAFATFCYPMFLNDAQFNYIVLGEGEFVFSELADFIINGNGNLAEIKGIAYKKDGEVILNPARDRIRNLDSLLWPDRELINFEDYRYPVTITTARGCPGDCIFCSSRSFWGNKIVLRSAQNILDEILHVEDRYGINCFLIIDDTFTISTKRAMLFSQLLIESGKKFIWACESRVDVITAELLEKLYEAGCRKIQFGMESANNDILEKIKKHVTIEQIENAILMANDIGFDINVSFIIGHAFDTHETIMETLEKALYFKKKYSIHPYCSINTPYPGTSIYDNAEEYGIEFVTKDLNKLIMDNAVINTSHIYAHELRNYYTQFQDVLFSKKTELKI